MGKVKVGVAGVGNACSSLIQGLQLCRELGERVEGVVRWSFAGYTPQDIEVVAAFDIDRRKVGRDLSEAIFTEPNNMLKLCEVPELGVTVERGPVLDGKTQLIEVDEEQKPVEVGERLKEERVDVLLCLVPSGAAEAARYYAGEAAKVGAAFVNATPNLIASDPEWGRRFREAKAPVIGDDLESQMGSTVLHKLILELMVGRGVRVKETYALDVGGSPESLHALDWEKTVMKRKVKTKAVKSALPYEVPVVAGSTDYVDFLGDFRDTRIWIRGSLFAGAPVEIELKIRAPDGANAVIPLMDSIRAAKVALDRGVAGPLESISAYHFKHPPVFLPPKEAERWLQEFIEGKREK
ncbi:MAG: inositol-3-phosphate synthase [Thermoproteota archaeon]|nr:MAG: inositol-3-phosphate synthase [Candidatus Korarchaeota archaeon]RLG55784.1 MAG: inositol-3-phosphate synthase [Candidatus Korarchaeota archaeon]